MLSIPRPTTRAECRDEARPCPWVSCRHHLLLEVEEAVQRHSHSRRKARPRKLRLNQPSKGKVATGRRPGLASSAAAALVRVWIDDAVELLSRMRYTCALDVVDDYPDGLPAGSVGWLLGVTAQAIEQVEGRGPVRDAMDTLREYT
jgi:hypothetical protein